MRRKIAPHLIVGPSVRRSEIDVLVSAITLNPNYAPAHLWLAHYLAARGRSAEALQEVQLARDLDPLSPIIKTQVGWIMSHAGH